MTRLKKIIWKFYRKFKKFESYVFKNITENCVSIVKLDIALDKQKERVSNLIYRYREELNKVKDDAKSIISETNDRIDLSMSEISRLRTHLNNLDKICEMINVKEAEAAYKRYTKKFRDEIKEHLDFKVNDSSIVRLASLEERLTKLEIRLDVNK